MKNKKKKLTGQQLLEELSGYPGKKFNQLPRRIRVTVVEKLTDEHLVIENENGELVTENPYTTMYRGNKTVPILKSSGASSELKGCNCRECRESRGEYEDDMDEASDEELDMLEAEPMVDEGSPSVSYDTWAE